jgi:hypothetical protein
LESGPPYDIENLLARLAGMEKELALLKDENTRLKAELARKDKIIAGLQQRLFESSRKKLDSDQLQLLFNALLLGKAAPPLEQGGETSVPEREKSSAPRTRRTKAERFPRNLKILIEKEIIPAEVLANPDAWDEIGEEYHDDLDVIKAEMFWRRTIRKKFIHKTDDTHATARHLAPSTGPSVRKSSRPAHSRSTKPPSTISIPTTDPLAKVAFGPIAIPPAQSATSNDIPDAELNAC